MKTATGTRAAKSAAGRSGRNRSSLEPALKPARASRKELAHDERAFDSHKSREPVISVGLQLRHYRQMRKLKLKELGDMAGCSESLLSRIENDQVNPSFTTLHRICNALEISISNMMSSVDDSQCIITRPGERVVVGRSTLRDIEHSEAEVFIPYRDGRLLEGLLLTMRPGGNSNGFVAHRGEEVGFILEGEFELTVAEETHLLGAGCTFFFRSDIPHSYRNPGSVNTRVLWINTPPSF